MAGCKSVDSGNVYSLKLSPFTSTWCSVEARNRLANHNYDDGWAWAAAQDVFIFMGDFVKVK